MNEFLEAALGYAKLGWAVFPCNSEKRPLTTHGFKDSSTDSTVIKAWWSKWPRAAIGIDCGKSQLLFVDCDVKNGIDGVANFRALEIACGGAIFSRTPSGGKHIGFTPPPNCSIRNSAGKLAPGVDIRAAGGYVIAPPSVVSSGTYTAIFPWNSVPLRAPRELIALLTPPPPPPPATRGESQEGLTDQDAYAAAALQGECEIVRRAAKGSRNQVLNTAAFRLGTLVGAQMLGQGQVEDALVDAAGANGLVEEDGLAAVKRTVESGLSAGKLSPRDPPVRYLPARKAGSRQPGPPEEESAADLHLSRDYGHAAVLSRLFRDRYLWANHRGSWMQWSGQVWESVDQSIVAVTAANELRMEYVTRLSVESDKTEIKWLLTLIRESNTLTRITYALGFLKGWEGFHVAKATDWDVDGWLLNVQNGVVDLKTRGLLPHDPSRRITKLTRCDYGGPDLGFWKKHIERFLPNENIRLYVQRYLGLALVGGHLSEEFPIWHGGGARGKSTTAKALQTLLRGYCIQAAPNLLLSSKYERHPTELADLCGARLVFSIEVEDGRKLAEALVKQLTGGDMVKARFMRQDLFEFPATWSFVLVANYRPEVASGGDAIWRRIRVVPWEVAIPKAEQRPQDDVIAELLADGPSMLRWLLAGLADWQGNPQWTPTEVVIATEDYRVEQDRLGGFFADCCELGKFHQVPVRDLYTAYEMWSFKSSVDPMKKRSFGKALRFKGITQKKTGHTGTRTWLGIRLKLKR